MKNFFVKYKNPIAFVLLIILAAGAFSYQKMESSLFPELTFPKIKIIADNGLQPVNKMMITVTKPLENAIKHGISRQPGWGTIRVEAHRRDARLEILVHNSAGPGEVDRPAPGSGFGLENVRQRLLHLFGERHSFSCGPVPSGGFDVRIGFPIEIPAAAPAPAG